MKSYIQVFVNYEHNNQAKRLPIATFTSNNIKNVSTSYTLFQLKSNFHPKVSYKEDIHLYPKSNTADKLADKLRDLMSICMDDFPYVQELQKCYVDKYAKPRSCASDNKVQLNSQYIKIQRNCKRKSKFFQLFLVLYLVKKQVYKVDLSKKQKIYDVSYMSLLE